MRRIKNIIIILAVLIGIFSIAFPSSADAYNICIGVPGGPLCPGGDLTVAKIIQIVSETLIFIIGVASVIVLIISGIRYVVSSGDSTAVGNAKNSILYAVIGIIISLSAYAIVHFVIGRLIS